MRASAAAKDRAVPDHGPDSARRPYRVPPSKLWWLERRAYTLFVVRELTSVFVAAYSAFLVLALHRIGEGPAAHAALLDLLASPLSVVAHLVVLAFVLFHAITWFNLTPKIMVVHRDEERVPPTIIAGLVYAAWLGFSALLLYLVLRG